MRKLILIALGAGVMVSACSSSGSPPKVASLGSSSTPTSVAPPVASGSGKPDLQTAEQYSECMRSHGVPDFPDPQLVNGGIRLAIRAGQGVDPNSAAFQSAQNACKKFLPNGGVQQQLTPAQQQQWLKWAACMRSHGEPTFPDPKFQGGGVQIGGPGSAIDPNSSTFQAAQTACKSLMPSGGPGPGG